jgi:hypothetical protein
MSPPRKTSLRRAASRERARQLLQAVAERKEDAYVGYRQLYGLWIGNNAAVPELRPLFRIPGIDANGTFSVSEEFRNLVVELSTEILPFFQNMDS